MDLAGLRGDSASVPQVDDVSRARYEQQHREKRDKDHLPAMEPPPEPTKRMKRIKRVWQDWKPHEGTAAKDAAISRLKAASQVFFYLHQFLIPHDVIWDDAQTKFDNTGRFPFYPLNECRDRTEKIQKTSKLSQDSDRRVTFGTEVIFYIWITCYYNWNA